MFYHVFKKTLTLKTGKKVEKWYYWWTDPVTNQQHQKSCLNAKTQADAYAYVAKLEVPDFKHRFTIAEICKNMFIPDSDHVKRLALMGKKLGVRTLENYRNYVQKISALFGDLFIEDLTIKMVNGYLMEVTDKSGSWKDGFLEALNYVYREAQWCSDKPIIKPDFPRFVRNSKKADIFTKEELEAFFDPANWTYGIRDYLILLVTASCGLRIGYNDFKSVKHLSKEYTMNTFTLSS